MLKIFVIAILLIFSVAISCTPDNAVSSDHAIKASFNGFPLADISADAISHMPTTIVAISDSSVIGPSLLSIMEMAGIVQFKNVIINGYNNNHINISLNLEEIEVINGMVLFLDNNGRVLLFGPELSENDQGLYVTELVAMPGECCGV